MAVTLRNLCENVNYTYGMSVLAGAGGLGNTVSWVHSIEDEEAALFLHGNELVFTTGIAHSGGGGGEWLLPFIRTLAGKKVSGLVVNFGPYISAVSTEVMEFCNENSFPLFQIPWKTRIVDITREFCNRIIENDREEESIGVIFRNIIFYPNDIREYDSVLERNGFDLHGNYCITGIRREDGEDIDMQKVRYNVEQKSHFSGCRYGAFRRGDDVFIVFCGMNDEDLTALIGRLKTPGVKMAVGSNRSRLSEISRDFRKVVNLLDSDYIERNGCLFYDGLGMKKILLSVDSTEVLEEYDSQVLGSLKRYDRENGTEYMKLLRKYIEHDGSVQEVAGEMYLHRNTINYQLGKLRKILGMDLMSLNDRLAVKLALEIEELYSYRK
jgi:hypothetical protein